jgi:hypothetical protein
VTYSFPICIPFSSFSCLIALANNSNTVLNKSGESGPLFHSWFLEEIPPFSIMLAKVLSYTVFIVMRCYTSILNFFRAFIMKTFEFFSKAFSASMKWPCDFCPWFYLCAALLRWSCLWWTTLHPWNEITLVMAYVLFTILLNLACNIQFHDQANSALIE